MAGILAGRPHPARPQPQSLPQSGREAAELEAIRAKRLADKRAREAARDNGGGEQS